MEVVKISGKPEPPTKKRDAKYIHSLNTTFSVQHTQNYKSLDVNAFVAGNHTCISFGSPCPLAHVLKQPIFVIECVLHVYVLDTRILVKNNYFFMGLKTIITLNEDNY
jgi:hypothetical protein